jgi:ubiquinone/menaquinone biosynthesis C-methylase UbiE
LKSQKQTWNELATVFGSCASTHPDEDLAELELNFILEHVHGRTLNVGCGNGFETWACQQKTGCAEGLDFSEEMVKVARTRFPSCKFTLGNVLNLPFPDDSFDTVTTRRTLINLLKRTEQARAIREIKRVVKNGGTVVLVEATEQGYILLNDYRRQFGLAPIAVKEFNLSMDENVLKHEFPDAYFSTLDTYYFLTRIYYPLVSEKVEYGTAFQKVAKEMQRKLNLPLRCSPHVLVSAQIIKSNRTVISHERVDRKEEK